MSLSDDDGASTAAVDSPSPRRTRGTRRQARLAWSIFLAVFGICGIFAGGHSYSSDEEGYYLQAQAFAHGDYALTIPGDAIQVTPVSAGRDGKPIATGGIGASVVALPALALGKVVSTVTPREWDDVVERLFVGFTNSLITAAIAAVLFLCALQLGATRKSSVLLAFVFVFGTIAWPHSKTMLFTEPIAALVVLTAVYFAFRAASEGSLLLSAIAGTFATLAGLARISTLMFALPIGLYAVLRHLRPDGVRRAARMGLAFTGGAVLGLLTLGLTNKWRAGSFTDLGYASVPLDGDFWEGIYGLLLSPGKGLLIYAPVIAVALGALPWAIRRKPAETSLLLVLALANLVLFARFPSWHGDNAWGPRYLNITLPLMVLLVAPLLTERRWRKAVAIAGVVGVLVNVLGVMVYFNQYFLVANQALAKPPVTDVNAYLDPIHFDPEWSPLVGHSKLLNDSVDATTTSLKATGAGPFPPPEAAVNRLTYYFRAGIDTWWYWLISFRALPWLMVLAPVLLLCTGLGLRGLKRSLGGEMTLFNTSVLGVSLIVAATVGLAGGPLTSSSVWLFTILTPATVAFLLIDVSRERNNRRPPEPPTLETTRAPSG